MYGGTVEGNLSNGGELDAFVDQTYLRVDFETLNPVYVNFDLSLECHAGGFYLCDLEDSTKTYLPVGAAPSAQLQLPTDKDSIVLWMPYYKGNKCFAGWSDKDPGSYGNNDSLFKVLSINNYHVFSSNTSESSAKTLYAIWKDCSAVGGAPTPTVVLKNGTEHATLSVLQKFGERIISHEVPDEGISLAGDAFDFYVNTYSCFSGSYYGCTSAEAGYSIDKSAFSLAYTYDDGNGMSAPTAVASMPSSFLMAVHETA